uniref:Uncharacterized protein n=1 Tax=Panagrolaimus davidi TaxID=227884 RepID=A0A914PDW2_9BILA
MKLAKVPEEDDFFVYDFMEKKYFYVGCPTKNFNPAPDPLDELDTDTESVYFGKDAPSIDWDEENELIERPKFDNDDSESSEDDSDEEGEDVVYGVQIISENLGNENEVEIDDEEEGEEGDDEAEENQSDEEDMELY